MAASNCFSPDEFDSSSSSSEDEVAMDFDISQIKGYAKEPELDESGSSSCSTASSEGEDSILRLDVNEWCRCGNCANMPTLRERICCVEVPACVERLEDAQKYYYRSDSFTCITHNPGFVNNCLLWQVLENVYGFFKQYCGQQPHGENDCRKWRYTAYRQLARFLHGVVGKDNRKVHPACAVAAIRNSFPKPDDEPYVGFIDSQ